MSTDQQQTTVVNILHYAFIALIFFWIAFIFFVTPNKHYDPSVVELKKSMTDVFMIVSVVLFIASWFVPQFKKLRVGIETGSNGEIDQKDYTIFVVSRSVFEFVAILGFISSYMSGDTNFVLFAGLLSLILMIKHKPKFYGSSGR